MTWSQKHIYEPPIIEIIKRSLRTTIAIKSRAGKVSYCFQGPLCPPAEKEGIFVSGAAVLEQEQRLASVDDSNIKMNAVDVASLDFDPELREQAGLFVGSIATGQLVDVDPVEPQQEASLQSATEEVRQGSEEARNRIRMCVSTDRFERRHKFGFTMPVPLHRMPDGTLVQFGQTLQQNTVNSVRNLKNPKMLGRAKGPEAVNATRLQEVSNRGLLKENYFVTISLVHGEMSDEEAEKQGFFVRTRSLCIQVVTENNDEIEMYSTFIAGKEGPNDEPFDMNAAREFARMVGTSFDGMSTEDILEHPHLFSKDDLPHGTASLSQMFDIAAYRATGKYKFYGRDTDHKPTIGDYLRKEEEDRRAVESASEDVDRVTQQLIDANTQNELEATAMLAKLNEEDLKRSIVHDHSIDAHVLGDDLAWTIYHARSIAFDPARQHELVLLQRKIDREGRSSSCPGGSSTEEAGIDELLGMETESQDESEVLEDCEFISKECPKCGKKDVRTECKDGVYIGECGCRSDK